jgi:hypothetical protein
MRFLVVRGKGNGGKDARVLPESIVPDNTHGMKMPEARKPLGPSRRVYDN